MSKMNELLSNIDTLKSNIDEYRPFSGDLLPQIRDFYRVGVTYSSNAIEGISYTETETKILLEEGLTAGGKPLYEALAVTGHAKAYDYMFELLHQRGIFTNDILAIHTLLEGGLVQGVAGDYRTQSIFVTGSNYVFPEANAVKPLMDDLDVWMTRNVETLHPIEFAALFHLKLVFIHPFSDGNGRTARLCMNTILIQNGYLPTIVPPILRSDYINSIKKAQERKNETDFIYFIGECVKESLKDMLRILRGTPYKKEEAIL